jgi:hypothetical protein
MTGSLMNDELARIWKEAVVAYRNLPGKSENPHENPVRITGTPAERGSKQAPLRCKSRALPREMLITVKRYRHPYNRPRRPTGL